VIKIANGKGAHGVFVTAPAAYSNAISYTGRRVGAIVMCIGFPSTGTTTIGADPSSFCFKNLTVKETLVGSMRGTDIALDFAKRGLLRQICEIYPIDKMPEAVEKLRKGEVAGRCVVDFRVGAGPVYVKCYSIMQAIFRASTSRQTYNRDFIQWRLVLENEIILKIQENIYSCLPETGQRVETPPPHSCTFQLNRRRENVE